MRELFIVQLVLLSSNALVAALPMCDRVVGCPKNETIPLPDPGLSGAARVRVTLPQDLDADVLFYKSESVTNCPSMLVESGEGWAIGSTDLDSNGLLTIPLTYDCKMKSADISSARSVAIPSAWRVATASIATAGMAYVNPYAGGFVAVMMGVLALTPSGVAQEPINTCECKPFLKVTIRVPDPSTVTISETAAEFECNGGSCYCAFNISHQVGCCRNNCPGVSSSRSKSSLLHGRPFTMPSGPALLAPKTCGSPDAEDWVENMSVASMGASMKPDPVAATHWYRVALVEHASVASFSRASLELMSVGAPMSLVEATHLAALDEVRHARTAFGLAKLFGHSAAGPGALPLPRLLEVSSTFPSIAVKTFREGCMSEVVAVGRAHLELSREIEPGLVKAALMTVAADEARHAALAWRTVAWALQRDSNVSHSLWGEHATIKAKASCRGSEDAADVLECYALRMIVLPWLDALLTTGTLSEAWPSSLAASTSENSMQKDLVAVVLHTSKMIADELNVTSTMTTV